MLMQLSTRPQGVTSFRSKIVIAGGTGALGSLLADTYIAKGWEVIVLTRSAGRSSDNGLRHVVWDGRSLGAWAAELEGAEAVVNLAGKNINTRFTSENRREILNSRIRSTTLIGDAILRCRRPPKVWVNAGGISIYASAESTRDERDVPDGTSFLAEVSKAWENAFTYAVAPGTRKVQLRIGSVLLAKKGMLAPLVKLARLGLGGSIGTGNQYISWIHGLDFVNLVVWLIEGTSVVGIVHASGPNPVTNRDFLQVLRRRLGVAIGIPAPTWAAKFGAFLIGTEPELALSGHRVISRVLTDEEFRFDFPELGDALDNLVL